MQSMPHGQPGFQTRSIHGQEPPDPSGALPAPIYMTSTYAFDTLSEAAAVLAGESDRYIYGRQHNPTQTILENRLAALEGAQAAVATACGMGAISSALLSLLAAGDEIVVHHTMYTNAMMLLDEGLPRLGIKVVKANLLDPEALERAVTRHTKLVYFESLVNPSVDVLDIAALSTIAHQAGARVMVDATFVSPALQRPLEHGADIVIHSLTKYINGHGDLLGGAVLGDSATIGRIRDIGLKYMTGSTLSPINCFLVLRGLKTLSLRMSQHGRSALRIAQMLQAHPAVRLVRYPFLQEDPGHAVAVKQMKHGSGMLSFELKTGAQGAHRMIDRLKLIKCAVSLGDIESLITQPGALLAGRQKVEPKARLNPGVSMDLIRLSVGLEDVEDLLADLEEALRHTGQ